MVRPDSSSWDTTSGRQWRRSEEHTSELQSLAYLVCRLLLEKKKTDRTERSHPNPLPPRIHNTLTPEENALPHGVRRPLSNDFTLRSGYGAIHGPASVRARQP